MLRSHKARSAVRLRKRKTKETKDGLHKQLHNKRENVRSPPPLFLSFSLPSASLCFFLFVSFFFLLVARCQKLQHTQARVGPRRHRQPKKGTLKAPREKQAPPRNGLLSMPCCPSNTKKTNQPNKQPVPFFLCPEASSHSASNQSQLHLVASGRSPRRQKPPWYRPQPQGYPYGVHP